MKLVSNPILKNFSILLLFAVVCNTALFGQPGFSGTGANYDVKYHKMWLRISPDSALYIAGNVQTNFLTTQNNVTSVSFDLNSVFLVDSVYFETSKLPSGNITRSGNILNINLGVSLPLNTLDSVRIYYQGVPPPYTSGPEGFKKFNTAGGGNYMMSVSESFEDRDWWPCKADMQDKIDGMEIKVNVPWASPAAADTFWVVANGMLVDSAISGNSRTFTYRTNYPVASYLVGVSVGRFNRYYRGTVNISGTNVPIAYNLLAGRTTAQYNSCLAAMDKMNLVLVAYSQKFGDYPFKNEKHGYYDGLVGAGGIEHQTSACIATGSLTSLTTLAHELMHQWFGDNVTTATWNDLWLAEGFANYSEALVGELVPSLGLNPYSIRNGIKTSALSFKTTSAWIPNSNASTSALIWNSNYGSTVYSRGAMTASMLRAMCGDTKYFQACRNYLSGRSGKAANTDTLRNYFNAVLGTDISQFFNDYIGGSGSAAVAVGGFGNPIDTISWNSPFSRQLKVRVASQGKTAGSNVAYFHGPVVLHIKGSIAAQDTTIVFFDWGGGNLSYAGNGLSAPVAGNMLSYTLSFTPVTVLYDDSARTLSTGMTQFQSTAVSGVTTQTCVGGSTGTITATGAGGTAPYTYNLNGGTYQASTIFSGLPAGTDTLGVMDNTGFTASVIIIVNPFATSPDNQNAAGTDSWTGHVYDGTNFSNYIGHFSESEIFNEGFGGSYTCFNVTSNALTSSIYTETFSVKYKMNSTRKGLYVADLGSGDGSRLTVDTSLVYNNWSDQVFSTRARVLMSLTGSSSLLYEFYGNTGANQVIFQNPILVLANILSVNMTQNISMGSSGTAVSGDVYGTLPVGISLSSTGYQWTYSTTPGGPRTNIPGANGPSFTPSTLAAPFNAAGTYYLYRNAVLSSANNVNPNPYIASNESNPATITTTSLLTATIGGTTGVCQGSTSPGITFTASNGTAPYTFTYTINGGPGLTVTTISGNLIVLPAPTGTAGSFVYSLVNVADVNFSRAQTGSATITVNALPAITGTTPATGCGVVTLFATASAGTINWYAASTGGSSIASGTSFTTPPLSATTTTYWVDATNNGCTSATRVAVTATMNPVSVVASSGTLTGCYPTLKAAFDNINNGIHKGVINISINNNTVETASDVLNASGTGSANYATINIQPAGGGARIISGSLAAPLIDLNGADNVTIDGLNSGGNALTILNASTSNLAFTSAIRFISGATNNTITNCTIEGSETNAAYGTILFSTATGTGNDDNTISNNTITSAGGNLPFNAIYSAGTSTAIDNSSISVLNNNIQDYYNPGGASNGIFLASNSSAWTITGNRFFQTATRTATAAAASPFNVHRAINIVTASGVSYTVSNNIIGYANASGTGLTTYDGAFANRFLGIEMTTGTATVSDVQGNIIGGISLSTSSGLSTAPGIFSGVSILRGNVNIGTTNGNTIGAITGTGSIAVTSATTGGYIAGIYATSISTLSIQNNNIGSINTGGNASTGYSFYGINTAGTAGNFAISSNTIGSTTTANSIAIGSDTTTVVSAFNGITNTATGTTSVTGNTIQNCSVHSTGASLFNGITNSGSTGVLNINTNNIVFGANTGTGSFVCISNTAVATTISIDSNISRNHTKTAGPGAFVGISNTGAAATAINIIGNQLGNTSGGALAFTSVSTAAITGIINNAGTATTTVTINNNLLQGFTVVSSGAFIGISNAGATGVAININNNQLGSSTVGVLSFSASTGTITGIMNSGGTLNTVVSISNNSIQGFSGVSAGTFLGINNAVAGAVVNITSNQLGNSTGSILTLTSPSVAAITGIVNSGGASVTTVNINNNSLQGFSVVSSGAFTGISNAGATGVAININNNQLGSSTVGVLSFSALTGAITGITNSGGTLNTIVSIYNNSIQGFSGVSSGTFLGINNAVAGAAINITYNQLGNSSGGILTLTNPSVAAITGIVNSGGAPVTTVNINNNSLQGFSVVSSGIFTGILNSGAAGTAININNNQLGTTTGNAITYSAANTTGVIGISNAGGQATCALSIQFNDIRKIVHSVAGTSNHTYIINSAATLSQNISTNTFTNLDVNTTGAILFISDNVIVSATGVQHIDGDSIVGSFTRSNTSVSGTLTLFNSTLPSIAGGIITNSNNNFSNITVSGAATIAGWINTDAGAGTKTIQGNSFSNWTGGTGLISAMNVSTSGAANAITGNTITNLKSAGNITAITTGAGNDNIYANTISSLVSTGTGSTLVNGIVITAGTTKNIYQNTISGLKANFNNITGTLQNSLAVNGIWVSGGTTVNVSQNVISGFTADAIDAGTLNGIAVSGGSVVTLSRNKIYDLSSNSTAINSGRINGILVFSATGSVTNIVNNMVGNLRTPVSGNSDALRAISANVTTVSNVNVYFNTLYLNAVSTGANFGCSGIYHASSANPLVGRLDLRNNIITNISTPMGTGLSVALRQYAAPLNNYASVSNNNLFYAGTPGPNKVIYNDATNSDQTITAFQARLLGNRDSLSFAEDLSAKILSLIGSSPYFLHIDTTKCTRAESGGVNITGITMDYDGQTRQGNPGYIGTGSAPDLGADEFEGSAIARGILAGTATICKGSSASLPLSVTGTGAISGTLSDGTAFSGAAPTITISVSPSVTTTYTIATLTNGTCTSNAADKTGSAIITVNARPTGAISGTAAICKGGNNNLIITATGSGTISGTLSDGTIFSGTAPTITIGVSPLITTTYTISTLANGTCTSIAADKTGSATVTVNARPTGILGGIASICNGGSTNLTITATGAGTISGTLSDGTAFSGTAPVITVSVHPSVTTIYTISTLTNGTCASIAGDKTGSATVTVVPSPSASISYPGSPFCSNTGASTVAFTGTAGGTYASTPAGALINPGSGTVNLAASLPGKYTITYTVTLSGCSIYTTSTVIIINPNTWTGAISTDWNTVGNWAAAAVPVISCADVTIPAGVLYQPTLSSGTFAIQNLFIDSGATVTITNATLQISGTINNSGTFDVSNGSIEMNGSGTQLIPADAFSNNALGDLVISNTSSGGVILGGALDIYGSVTYSGTGKKLFTNDVLTLKSTATKTARIGDITGNAISGKVTVERYISAHKAWQFLSVPTNTSQTIKQSWQEGATDNTSNPVAGYGIQITGAAGLVAGFDLYTATPSIKTYNSASNTWAGIPGTFATIKSMGGYMAFVRGDRTANSFASLPTQTVLRTWGDLYTGSLAPVTVGAGNFTSIGNPYASAVDMRNISKTGVKDFFYLWDPKLGGNDGLGAYQAFSMDGSGNYIITPGMGSYDAPGSVSNYIESGQAFLVQGTAAGGSLTFTEDAKSNGSSLVSRFAGTLEPQLRTSLYRLDADSTYIIDGVLSNYSDDYNNAVDDMDALKSTNIAENLSIKTTGKLLVVERRHTIMKQDTIFLNLSGMKVRKYRFQFSADRLNQPGLMGFLTDNYLHTSTPLNLDGSTIVDFNIENIPGSYAAGRFSIVFSQLSTLPVTFTSIKAYQENNDIAVEWKTENENNLKQYTAEKSLDGNHFSIATTVLANNAPQSGYSWIDVNPSTGYNYYRIVSTDINGKTKYSTVAKVFIAKINPAISIYPNPVTNGTINLQLTAQPAGEYGIRLLNKTGQGIAVKQIHHAEGSSTEKIQVDKYMARGVYQLEVTKPDGNIINLEVIY